MVRKELNIPNLLTLVRALLTLPLVYFILQDKAILALAVFLLAMSTEIDGTIARKLHQETAFGMVFDPLVDALFMGSGALALIIMHNLSVLFLAVFVIANIPRAVFMYLFHKRRGKFKSTLWTKFSGLLGTFIIPLAIFDFRYLNEYIVAVSLFTVLLMVGVGREYGAIRNR